jgi:predicted metalloprotease
MTFRDRVRLNPGQVRDLRGRRAGVAVGGGAGIILLVLYLLLSGGGGGGGAGVDPQALDELLNRTIGQGQQPESSALATCQTGADANRRDDCRIVGYVNSIQEYWTDTFAASGETYEPAQTTFFSGSVSTGCGQATSAVGPFYCPSDRFIYIDLEFFDVMRSQLDAQGGPLAQAYVLAHEYGHHVQNLTGVLQRAQSGETGPESDAVRVELQADCYAGSWAGNAVDTGYLEPLTSAQIADALDAAAAVGDDRIQEKTQGQVNPESWTHGSAEQRQSWFRTGYETADAAECDTFAAEL